MYISLALICAIFLGYGARLTSLQLVHGAEYAEKGDFVSVRNRTVEAARGEILDRNGSPIVTNRQGNSLIFDASYFPIKENKAQNDIILALINLLAQRNEAWIDNLPLVFGTDGAVSFAPDRDTDIAAMKDKDILNLNPYATAQNCYDALIEKYELQEYAQADARKIASVRYEMTRLTFPTGVSTYTFAEDVSTTTVSMVKEQSAVFQGVDMQVVPYREYTDGTLAPHIVGRAAAIDADEYKAKKADGYSITDEIGKFGIEQAAEKYLRGTNGKKRVTVKKTGESTEEYTKTPEQGNTVILTLDANLQKTAQNALDQSVAELASNPKYIFASGAAVVIDVRNGDILACASNPNYDITQYAEKYDELSKAANAPLWNRPLMSAYAPGSSFKPGMALAGLEEGIIKKETTITCNRPYHRFPDIDFGCLGIGHAAGSAINAVDALKYSCNIFFYEDGYQLGVDKMAEYSKKYGFGQATGVELPEATGNLSTPAYAHEMAAAIGSDPDAAWTEGMVIQTAIGQAYNMMTPIQMANYCAMIATGGTRYVPHFIKSVKSYDYSQTLVDNNDGTVAAKENFKPENIATIKEGMYAMATYSGNDAHKLNLGRLGEIGVAAKSGTPQLNRVLDGKNYPDRNNGFLIAFAPYDNPQIAMCITIEDGYHSRYAVKVAQAILNEYFFGGANGTLETAMQAGSLLS